MITLGRDEFPDEVLTTTITELHTLFAKRAAAAPRTDRGGKQLIEGWFTALSAEKKRLRGGR